jgi:AcrR family transcriptional regulator
MPRSIQLPAPGRGAYDRSLSRSERDAEHRERLLLAAAEVSVLGPATVARIVEHAGVGRSTFYEFFDSPEHVLEHLEQRVLRALEASLARALAEARTPLERLRALVRAWLRELEARPLESRVVLTRRPSTELLSPAGKLFHDLLTRTAQAARQGGVGWFNSTDDLSLLAAAAGLEVVTRRHLAGPAVEDAPRSFTELITRLLR